MKPRTLYLHIGLPKTGSTFLQQRVFPKLSRFSVISMPHNHYFQAELGERLLATIFSRSDTIWKRDADTILDQLLGTGWQRDDRDILLSDEAVGRLASRQGLFAAHLAGMKEALRERGVERLKILCFVRRQDHWLMSHYVQMSDRRPNACQTDLEALIARICDPKLERFTFGALLDFASIRAAAASVLAEENLSFLPMEWLRTDPVEIARNLAEFLDRPDGSLALDALGQENVRQLGRNRWQLRPPSRLARLRRKLARQDEHVVLSAEISRNILETYRSCNEELEARTRIDVGSLGYFPTL